MSARAREAATRWPTWAVVVEARQRAGLTQTELATKIGTSQAAIARYERARAVPDLATLHRIVEACGFELELRLAEPDAQRGANELAAFARSVEDRIRSNDSATAVGRALRRG